MILGVRMDNGTMVDSRQKVRDFLRSDGQHALYTPNPEILVDAARDGLYREILNRSSLNICDGTGLAIVTGGKLQRIAGVDFMLDTCRIAEEEGKSIYLLGSMDDQTLLLTRDALMRQFPLLKIVGYDIGVELRNSGIKELVDEARTDSFQKENDQTIDRIIAKAPDILFVAFGSRKQEWWIDTYQSELPSVKLAMGVGGSFDFISGRVPRAPILMRQMGLEWLWRFIVQPWRWKRIWKATVVFLYLYLLSLRGH